MKRFEMHCDGFGGVSFDEEPDGMWVAYDEVLKRIPAYEPPPCECCEQLGKGTSDACYVAWCDCGNLGDHEAAVRWCARMEIADSFEEQ